MNQELYKLLEKNVITPVTVNKTPIFTIPKKRGAEVDYQPQTVEQICSEATFQNGGAHLLRDLLIKDDWMVKMDLKEAYYAVPIHQESRATQFPLGGETLLIHMPTIWPLVCTESLYQSVEAGSGAPERERYQINNLH